MPCTRVARHAKLHKVDRKLSHSAQSLLCCVNNVCKCAMQSGESVCIKVNVLLQMSRQ